MKGAVITLLRKFSNSVIENLAKEIQIRPGLLFLVGHSDIAISQDAE